MPHASNRRSRRPGSRLPDRLSKRYRGPVPGGFTSYGIGSYYRWLLPGLRGREFFNRISGGLILGMGLGGAVLGYTWFGLLGAILGLGAGLAAGGSLAEKQRFFRR